MYNGFSFFLLLLLPWWLFTSKESGKQKYYLQLLQFMDVAGNKN